MDKKRICKTKPIVLTREEAIQVLNNLRDYLTDESIFSTTDVELKNAISDIDTSIALLKVSCLPRVIVQHTFNSRNATKLNNRIYLPKHHGIWEKFCSEVK